MYVINRFRIYVLPVYIKTLHPKTRNPKPDRFRIYVFPVCIKTLHPKTRSPKPEAQQVPDLRGFPSGIIRSDWNDTEKISMAPAQG